MTSCSNVDTTGDTAAPRYGGRVFDVICGIFVTVMNFAQIEITKYYCLTLRQPHPYGIT